MTRPSGALRASAVALVLAVSAGGSSSAQTSPDSAAHAPYSRLRLRLSGARVVNREPIDDFWQSGTGGGFAISTPFYLGSIGVGATLIPFRARDAAQRPNFRAVILGIDWGADIPLPGPLRARAAARVGDFVMLIENPERWLDSESELLVGGELSAGLPVYRDFSLIVAGSVAHVFTRPSLDLALVTLGIEYAARTPSWLRAILE